MANTLKLEIVTPKGIALSEDVEEVVAPSVHGEFGVLPGHLPMLAALQVGLLRFKKPGGSDFASVAIGAGFVEVFGDKTLLLTDRFTHKDAIDVLAVRKRLKEVDEKLEAWTGELDAPERLELIEEEQWLAAELELYGDPPVSRVLEYKRANDYSKLLLFPPAPEPMGEGHEGQPAGVVEVDGSDQDRAH